MSTSPIDLKASFNKNISGLGDFCRENNLKITDTNGNGIFDADDKVEYSVQPNDTLSKIARKYKDCSWKQLERANKEKYPNANKIRPGDSIMIPLKDETQKATNPIKAGSTSATQPQKAPANAKKETPSEFKTRDFGGIKTKKVTDDETIKGLKGKDAKSLKKDKYFFDDKNGNGILDEGEGVYKQVTVMLDAGHGTGKYLRKGQTISIPGKGSYTTKDSDTFESIAQANNISVEQLKKANAKAKLGYDPGAVSAHGKLTESDITGMARNELAAKLRANGFDVIMAERTDKPHLKERQNEKVDKSPDMYVSIHCNAANGNARGEEVCYRDDSDQPFAKAISDSMAKEKTFETRKKPLVQGKFMVLGGDNDNKTAECLVELGFMSDAGDYGKLANAASRGKQIGAISDGVVDYYNKHKE